MPTETFADILAELDRPDAYEWGVYPHEWAQRLRQERANWTQAPKLSKAIRALLQTQWPTVYAAFRAAFLTGQAQACFPADYAIDANRRLALVDATLALDEPEAAWLVWPGAYSAFVGAYDTPLARRQRATPDTQAARTALREFNDALFADSEAGEVEDDEVNAEESR